MRPFPAVFAILALVGCKDPGETTCLGSPEAGSRPDAGTVADLLPGKPFGWVENDDGKGGKLVDITWTWENPLPQGNRLNEVWGTSLTDVYAVGDHGTILHFDGAAWKLEDSGTTADLYDVWGCGGSVFAVGDGGTIVRRATQGWSPMQSETSNRLRGVWCNRPGNLFVVGDNRTLRRFDGSSWTAMTWTNAKIPKLDNFPLTLYSVWGPGTTDTDVFAGEDWLIRFDGSSWSVAEMEFWVIGIFRNPYRGIWGTSANSVYIAAPRYVFHFDGVEVKEMEWEQDVPELALRGIWGSGDSDIVAVTESGLVNNPSMKDWEVWPALILRYDGAKWTTIKSPTMQSLLGVWGAAGQYLAVGDKGTMIRFDGNSWTLTSTGFSVQLRDIAAGPGDTRVAVGPGGTLLRCQGNQWGIVQLPEDWHINAAWVIDAAHVYLVGQRGGVYHHDGVKAAAMQSGTDAELFDIWGEPNGHLVAVGARGTIIRFDGKVWSPEKSPIGHNIYAVAGRAPNDIYAVGERSTVLHFDGTRWKTVVTGGYSSYQAVAPVRANDVYVAGLRSVHHFDGTSWKTTLSGFRCDIEDLQTTGTADVLGTTACGDLLFFDGSRWIAVRSPTGKPLRSAWTDEKGFRVVGDDGTVLRGRIQ